MECLSSGCGGAAGRQGSRVTGQQGALLGTESGSGPRTLLLDGSRGEGEQSGVCWESRVHAEAFHGRSWKIRVPFSPCGGWTR